MPKKNNPVGQHSSPILMALPAACASESEAVAFIEQLRWSGSPACPRCGDTAVTQMKGRDGSRNARFLWRCHSCATPQFSVRIGTIFEDSRIPLRVWCHAFWRACASKKGVSALQISRECKLSYKSALFLMHRIRFVMAGNIEQPRKLQGEVEADETYVGGKPRHRQTREELQYKPREDRKVPVFAIVERGGEVRAAPMARVDSANIKRELLKHVEPTAKIYTDEARLYHFLGQPWPGGHEAVNHSRHEYARGAATTNRVESYFSLLKRGIYGTFHSVSRKHLHRYVDEFSFRFNTRGLDDGERTLTAIQKADGKRLKYRSHLAAQR